MCIRVLFLSRNNAARSQMAEYLLNQMGHGRFEAVSAGNDPAPVHPLLAGVLEEIGIDAKEAASKPLEIFAGDTFDYVINICEQSSASCTERKDDCPSLPGVASQGCWGFGNMPHGEGEETLTYLRKVREQIGNRLCIWMPAVERGQILREA